jgi:hypothetical protein
LLFLCPCGTSQRTYGATITLVCLEGRFDESRGHWSHDTLLLDLACSRRLLGEKERSQESTFSWLLERRAIDTGRIPVPTFVYQNYLLFISFLLNLYRLALVASSCSCSMLRLNLYGKSAHLHTFSEIGAGGTAHLISPSHYKHHSSLTARIIFHKLTIIPSINRNTPSGAYAPLLLTSFVLA